MHPAPTNALKLTRETLRFLEHHEALQIQGGASVPAPRPSGTPLCRMDQPNPQPWGS